jgi:hypothetical protein
MSREAEIIGNDFTPRRFAAKIAAHRGGAGGARMRTGDGPDAPPERGDASAGGKRLMRAHFGVAARRQGGRGARRAAP